MMILEKNAYVCASRAAGRSLECVECICTPRSLPKESTFVFLRQKNSLFASCVRVCVCSKDILFIYKCSCFFFEKLQFSPHLSRTANTMVSRERMCTTTILLFCTFFRP